MVYISALLGGICVNISIAAMALLQEKYKGPDCRRAREIMLGTVILAVVCSSLMLFLEWAPFVGAVGASLAASGCLFIIGIANFYASSQTKLDECSKARMYSIVLGIVYILLGGLIFLLTWI